MNLAVFHSKKNMEERSVPIRRAPRSKFDRLPNRRRSSSAFGARTGSPVPGLPLFLREEREVRGLHCDCVHETGTRPWTLFKDCRVSYRPRDARTRRIRSRDERRTRLYFTRNTRESDWSRWRSIEKNSKLWTRYSGISLQHGHVVIHRTRGERRLCLSFFRGNLVRVVSFLIVRATVWNASRSVLQRLSGDIGILKLIVVVWRNWWILQENLKESMGNSR